MYHSRLYQCGFVAGVFSHFIPWWDGFGIVAFTVFFFATMKAAEWWSRRKLEAKP